MINQLIKEVAANKGFVLLFVCVLFSFSGKSQVSVKVDTTKIRIGEQISYEIHVDKDEVKEVYFPKLNVDSLKMVEVVESFDIDSVQNSFFKKYMLTSFDSGRYMIPRQAVMINDVEHYTDSIFIDVTNVEVDTLKQKLFHIKPIEKEPYTFDDFKKYLWWLLAVLLVVGLILYFVFRKKPEEVEPESKIPPFELAKKRLLELDSRNLIQQQRIKLYYVELTDILRTFIENDLNMPALESTTDELLETINDFNKSSNLNIPSETILKLKRLLQSADLVKFAKSKPLANEIDLHRQDAEIIIEDLHPKVKTTKEDEDDR